MRYLKPEEKKKPVGKKMKLLEYKSKNNKKPVKELVKEYEGINSDEMKLYSYNAQREKDFNSAVDQIVKEKEMYEEDENMMKTKERIEKIWEQYQKYLDELKMIKARQEKTEEIARRIKKNIKTPNEVITRKDLYFEHSKPATQQKQKYVQKNENMISNNQNMITKGDDNFLKNNKLIDKKEDFKGKIGNGNNINTNIITSVNGPKRYVEDKRKEQNVMKKPFKSNACKDSEKYNTTIIKPADNFNMIRRNNQQNNFLIEKDNVDIINVKEYANNLFNKMEEHEKKMQKMMKEILELVNPTEKTNKPEHLNNRNNNDNIEEYEVFRRKNNAKFKRISKGIKDNKYKFSILEKNNNNFTKKKQTEIGAIKQNHIQSGMEDTKVKNNEKNTIISGGTKIFNNLIRQQKANGQEYDFQILEEHEKKGNNDKIPLANNIIIKKEEKNIVGNNKLEIPRLERKTAMDNKGCRKYDLEKNLKKIGETQEKIKEDANKKEKSGIKNNNIMKDIKAVEENVAKVQEQLENIEKHNKKQNYLSKKLNNKGIQSWGQIIKREQNNVEYIDDYRKNNFGEELSKKDIYNLKKGLMTNYGKNNFEQVDISKVDEKSLLKELGETMCKEDADKFDEAIRLGDLDISCNDEIDDLVKAIQDKEQHKDGGIKKDKGRTNLIQLPSKNINNKKKTGGKQKRITGYAERYKKINLNDKRIHFGEQKNTLYSNVAFVASNKRFFS